MGCCQNRNKEILILEDELEALMKDKEMLTQKVLNSEKFSTGVMPELEKVMNIEQYETSKILEILSALTGYNHEDIKGLSQQMIQINLMESNEKLLKYAELRYEQTKLQKKILRDIEEAVTEFSEVVDRNYKEIDQRLDLLKRVLSNNPYFSSRITSLSDQFSSISSLNKTEIHFLLSKQKSLIQIETLLTEIEKSSPAFNSDTNTNIKITEIEKSLSGIMKQSINSLKSLSLDFEGENSELIDSKSLKSLDFNIETYAAISDSIVNWLENLSEIEQKKQSILKNNTIMEDLIELDKKLVFYFNDSGSTKDQACSRLQRLSRSQSQNSSIVDSFIQYFDIGNLSLSKTVSALKEKTAKFLEKSAEQDQVVLEMTQKFALLDEKIDEIELKLHEFILNDIKDLYSIVPLNDTKSKELLDDLKQQLNQTTEESTSDLIEHVSKSLKQVELAAGLTKIRETVRDSHAEDVKKSKNELKEKIYQLDSEISRIQSEKSSIESSLDSFKTNHEKTLEMLDEKLGLLKQKDEEITNLKNSLGSLNEKYEEIVQENILTKSEIENLIKENKDCKKRLKTKENELEELRSKPEKE